MNPPLQPRKGGAPAEPPSLDMVMAELKRIARPAWVLTMKRVGIAGAQMWGISVPDLRRIGRRLGTDQRLARDLWETGVHEARLLATLVADPKAAGAERCAQEIGAPNNKAARWIAAGMLRELQSPAGAEPASEVDREGCFSRWHRGSV